MGWNVLEMGKALDNMSFVFTVIIRSVVGVNGNRNNSNEPG